MATTVVATAIAFAPRSSDAFATPKLAALIFGTALTAGTAALFGRMARRLAYVWLVILGALLAGLWSSADFVGAPYHRHGLALLGALSTLGIVAAHTPTHLLQEAIHWALVCVAAVVGAYAWIQAFGLDAYRWSITSAPISTLGNPNSVGCLGLM